MAFNLEHLAGINDLIQIRLPNYNVLLNQNTRVERPGPFFGYEPFTDSNLTTQ